MVCDADAAPALLLIKILWDSEWELCALHEVTVGHVPLGWTVYLVASQSATRLDQY